MFIKVGRQGAMTSQIAGAAFGTHKHDIENNTLSVAKEYLYLLVGPGRYIVPVSRALEILLTPPY